MNPALRSYRFAVLLCASLMAFGSYFAYDSVGAIETTLIKVFHADRSAIGAMYSVYSIAAVFAVLYFALFRRWLKARLFVKDQASNADAVVGKMGVVTKRIGQRDCGLVKVGSEEWRAELVQPADSVREVGSDVQIVSVEGVTLKVK